MSTPPSHTIKIDDCPEGKQYISQTLLCDFLLGWQALQSLCMSLVGAKCAPTASSFDRSSPLTASLDLSWSFPLAYFRRKPVGNKKVALFKWSCSAIYYLHIRGIISTMYKAAHTLIVYTMYKAALWCSWNLTLLPQKMWHAKLNADVKQCNHDKCKVSSLKKVQLKRSVTSRLINYCIHLR